MPRKSATASLTPSFSEKGKTPNIPVLVEPKATPSSNSYGNTAHSVHPFARSAGPLASAEIPGGRWLQGAYVTADIFLVLLNVTLVSRFAIRGAGSSVSKLFALQVPSHDVGFLVLYGGVVALFCHTQGLYQTARGRSRMQESIAVGKSVCFATVLLMASIHASGILVVSRLVIWASALLNIFALSAWRFWKRGVVERRRAAGIGVKNVLIVGAGSLGQEVASYLDENKQFGLVVKGFLDQDSTGDPRVIGKIEDLSIVARSKFVDEIIVSITSPHQLLQTVILEAKRNNLGIKLVPDWYGNLGRQITLQHIGDIPMISPLPEPVPAVGRLVKRIFDVLGASLLLLALSPSLIVIAILIKFDSKGPVLYRSMRVGKKGKPFVFFKFRTMVANADSLKNSLRHLNERDTVTFKIAKDPRVTRFGKIMRKYSLDELPQLWNVFLGNMSLVGPRPHPVDDYKHYGLEHLCRLDVCPGITGLWQVTARRDPSFHRNVVLDLEYIQKWNFWMDIKILCRTVRVVVTGDGT